MADDKTEAVAKAAAKMVADAEMARNPQQGPKVCSSSCHPVPFVWGSGGHLTIGGGLRGEAYLCRNLRIEVIHHLPATVLPIALRTSPSWTADGG